MRGKLKFCTLYIALDEATYITYLYIELAHYHWVRPSVHLGWLHVCFELLHGEDELVRVRQIEILLNQVLSWNVTELVVTFEQDL